MSLMPDGPMVDRPDEEENKPPEQPDDEDEPADQ